MKQLDSKELLAFLEAKQAEVQKWVRNAIVEAASKEKVSPRTLMRMRGVLTKTSEMRFKIVQRVTDPHLAHL